MLWCCRTGTWLVSMFRGDVRANRGVTRATGWGVGASGFLGLCQSLAVHVRTVVSSTLEISPVAVVLLWYCRAASRTDRALLGRCSSTQSGEMWAGATCGALPWRSSADCRVALVRSISLGRPFLPGLPFPKIFFRTLLEWLHRRVAQCFFMNEFKLTRVACIPSY